MIATNGTTDDQMETALHLSIADVNYRKEEARRKAPGSPAAPGLAVYQTATTQTQDISSEIERLLISGDLSQLNPRQRIQYYQMLCSSLDLNPLTKPFEFILLNGKLVLYAKKDCTEQLRAKRCISVQIVSREVVDGVYVVVSRASMPTGRCDESIGAVPIDGLKGEARANAIMKTETKSKRRVTLSICGLGILDETEVASIPRNLDEPIDTGGHSIGTRAAQDYVRDKKLAQIAERKTPQPTPQPEPDPPIPWAGFSEMLRCFASLKARIPEADYYRILDGAGVKHANQLQSKDKAAACYRAMKSFADGKAVTQ